MTKFNVGDWVRANDDAVNQFTKGKIYKVVSPSDQYGDVLVEVDDRGSKTNGWNEDYFDLVRRADEPWQVGDVVGFDNKILWEGSVHKLTLIEPAKDKTEVNIEFIKGGFTGTISHKPSYKEIDLVAQKANVNIKDTHDIWQAIIDSGFVIVKG